MKIAIHRQPKPKSRMKAKANLHLVPGSEKTLPKGAKLIGKTKAADRVEITVLLRARKPLPSLEELCAPNAQPLSHDQFREQHGADPADIEKVETFAAEHGLSVSQTSRAQRTLRLSGTVAQSARFEVRRRWKKQQGPAGELISGDGVAKDLLRDRATERPDRSGGPTRRRRSIISDGRR